MLRVGVVNEETWGFFDQIYEVLRQHYETTVFQRRSTRSPVFYDRINRFLLQRDMQGFMRANDVVFFEWASELLAFASRLEKTCGIVTRLHRYELYQWVDRVNWHNVDRVILVSEAKRQKFSERFPEHAHKTVVIPEATSLDQFSYIPREFAGNLGTLCHLTPRKRVYDLILTFSELCNEGENYHLHIAGGAHPSHLDYYEALVHLVERLNLEERVTFYDNVAEPWNWYPQIDIFISNSYSEGLQVAPMEAMASGCFCLSHHWAGAEELLPAENLFSSNNELKQLIRRHAACSSAERASLRECMRDIACEKFDIRLITDDIRGVIEEVGAAVGPA